MDRKLRLRRMKMYYFWKGYVNHKVPSRKAQNLRRRVRLGKSYTLLPKHDFEMRIR